MSVAAAAAALQEAEQAARVAKAEEADARTALDAALVGCGWRRVVGLVGRGEAYYVKDGETVPLATALAHEGVR